VADDFDPYLPFFGQPDAVLLTQVDNDTLDNWVRYKHVLPVRVGKRRMFSFLDLLRVDLMWMLARTFRTEVGVAEHIAGKAAKNYLDGFDNDRADILNGVPWAALRGNDRGDFHYDLTRDVDGQLRATTPDDDPAASVMLVLPARLIGRRLLDAIARWSGDLPAAGTDGGNGAAASEVAA
jgi:hypothetical protein